MATLLAMLLLGQVLVTTASPCPGGLELPAAMAGMDHSMHDMGSMARDGAPSQSCCEEDGPCSMPGCLAAPALPGQQMLDLSLVAISFTRPLPQRAPEHATDTHYRPPISP